MTKNYSLILGPASDAHVQHVRNSLSHQSRRAICLDFARYPEDWAISWDPRRDSGLVSVDEVVLNLDQIRSVYWRNATLKNSNSDALTASDCSSMLRFLLTLPNVHWVNGISAIEQHKNKPRQLHWARTLGATIPNTYVGNCPRQAAEFLGQNEQAIFKPVHGSAYTKPVTSRHRTVEHLERVLSVCPITLQEFIEGTNIRTYVIGHQVYSAEIWSESIDFRKDHGAIAVPIETPKPITELSRRLMRRFDMQWTAIDWRRDNDGHYVFLEANPSPMFIEFERVTNYPITDALTGLLLSANHV